MRIVIVFLIIFSTFTAFGQDESELLIFNADGNSYIQRSGTKISNIDGAEFKKDDLLFIINGSVTIISRQNKRVTLNENGKYNYNKVYNLMQKAEASVTNKYFVNVWDQMNNKHENMNYRGGVVRGDAVPSFPVDSAVILSDSICFEYIKEGETPGGISIKNEQFRELFYLNLTDNSIVMPLSDINNAETGIYYYEFDGSPTQCFIIPSKDELNEKLEAFNKIMESFSSFNDEMKARLVRDYMIENKVYILL
mgnify:CR=1 FL=1